MLPIPHRSKGDLGVDRRMMVYRFIVAAFFIAMPAMANSRQELVEKTSIKARQLIEPQLARYCGEACQLITLEVDVGEDVDEFTELGFESTAGEAARARLVIEKINAVVQIDAAITSQNKQRLEAILQNQLRSMAMTSLVQWQTVEIPDIGQRLGTSSILERQLESELEQAVQKIIQNFCPDQCMLSVVSVKGRSINADEADNLQKNQIVRDASNRNFMRIESATIDLALDESLDEASQQRIANMVRANTRFASPLELMVSATKFPESYAEKQKKAEDPYGLEKLRQMLIMFRDLAGTKEIITNSSSSSENKSVSSDSSKEVSASSETSLNKSAVIDSKQSSSSSWLNSDDMIMWGAIGIGIILIGFLALRLSSANRDAKIMVDATPSRPAEASANPANIQRYDDQGRPVVMEAAAASNGKPTSYQEISMKLKAEKLKDELTQHFMYEPRVAKETFSRMLKEDGVELTARYLHIFGHMILLELIEDPNISRDLYALSEFFNKSRIELTLEEEFRLLQALKTRQTASEIKVMTSKGSDKFEFLERLDPTQIFTLINEEKPQVQGIVLTQLNKKRRMSVFDMYQGRMKVSLMNELCRADAIPKEYLANVAKALHKKVFSRPEFDTENIRSSEIIIDLLERSTLDEQRQIMGHLRQTNADTARGIMMRLVTLEILPYLKDGHLLEIILGLEREDLLMFLAGTGEHIRNLFMSKAPYDLVETWLEELNQVGIVEESNYKLVELKVFNKIRNLANTGVINILEINEMIYSPDHAPLREDQPGSLSEHAVVA
jgi:flagellar motor switch protein FliG